MLTGEVVRAEVLLGLLDHLIGEQGREEKFALFLARVREADLRRGTVLDAPRAALAFSLELTRQI